MQTLITSTTKLLCIDYLSYTVGKHYENIASGFALSHFIQLLFKVFSSFRYK